MSDELENKLHRALHPVDPGEVFTARVMAQISARATDNPFEVRARRPRRAVWIATALAASLTIVVVGVYQRQQQQRQAGLAARAQVLEALRVTSQKLDLAYRLVNMPPPPATDRTPGA